MSKRFFAMAFAIGLLAVLWVGAGFVGSSWLALAVTAVIGGVYLLGAHELRQFRAGTAALASALADVPQPLANLAEWLDRVPATLRGAVRLRIEGERGGLPGPALTPYLVGLLVMLGMLGTFLGMVVTFKGAVFALEGSTDLQAIRSALAAPIRGLGLSFGTSVAGVAASAMLGLMSAVARRERPTSRGCWTSASPPCSCRSRWCTSGRKPSGRCRSRPARCRRWSGNWKPWRSASSARPSARRATAGAPGRVPPRSDDGVRHPRATSARR
jgi:hypothetical protein